MTRSSVDVVVPFRGTLAELESLRACLGRLALGPHDSIVVVDNSPGATAPPDAPVPVLVDGAVPSPGYARNRGAAVGQSEWLVFLDADTVPAPDLLDRFFDPPPGERTALLAGGVVDEAVPRRAPPVARYAHIRGLMSQENTFQFGDWSFPQSANVACRRSAFEAAGGFREDIRAGEDADLTFRLKAAGWEVERREAASVVHRSRQTVRTLVAQKAGHGAGGAWLAERYPGAFPARPRRGLVWWGVRTAVKGVLAACHARDRDVALFAIFHPLELIAFEFGRSRDNWAGRDG